ncbi:MAG: NAD-dependent epimerase/dehydratase family protein [Christensenella sp.]|nr:NAD-dependent epimerase/dehydratase family protein [Christensenella sp.]
MTKKILVIGGSYFIGRVFSILASREEGIELHVVNRGRFPLKNERITEYQADRHDAAMLRQVLPRRRFDAIIDFCAYAPGEIKTVLSCLAEGAGQYIYLSSCSVFQPSFGTQKQEDAPKLTAAPEGPAGEYAWGKLLLESECAHACGERQTAYTILRPSFVYGPFNYAPRETWYFKQMMEGNPIPFPTDSHCAFQFVYVKDIARALLACTNNRAAFDTDYNLAAPEKVTYESWMELLRQVSGAPVAQSPVTVAQAYAENIALPFPLDQDELYDGSKIVRDTGFAYTPLADGMQETYDSYRRSFG